ncbi:hypothetical protein JCM3766R1_002786 [Sporobolomyces carnicolor]
MTWRLLEGNPVAKLVFRPLRKGSSCDVDSLHAIESVARHAQNDVVLVFPSQADATPDRLLWSKSTLLTESSGYFRTLFESVGFAETMDKIEPSIISIDGAATQRDISNTCSADGSVVSLGLKEETGGGAEGSKSIAKEAKAETVDQVSGPSKVSDEDADDAKGEDSDLENDYYPPAMSSPRIHRIVVREAAYRTCYCYLYYLGTGTIEFEPLSSLLPSGTIRRSTTRSFSVDAVVPSCSPKSMYRLASYYEHEALRRLAFEFIESQLDCCNALLELMSDLAADYDEIKTLCFKAVLNNWSYIKDSKQMQQIEADLKRGILEERKVGLVFELFSKLRPIAWTQLELELSYPVRGVRSCSGGKRKLPFWISLAF